MNKEYKYEQFRSGALVPEVRRPAIIHAMNHELICTNWDFDYPHYSDKMHPFHDKYSIIFASDEEGLVGYTIYQFSSVNNVPAVYRFASEVKKNHQGNGLYKALTNLAFDDIWSRLPDAQRFLFAWRTRNPIVWRESAKRCKNVSPALTGAFTGDFGLTNAGEQLAKELYPETPLEKSHMIMRNVYTHMRYREQPYLKGRNELNDIFDRLIPKKEDSFFSIGVVERK